VLLLAGVHRTGTARNTVRHVGTNAIQGYGVPLSMGIWSMGIWSMGIWSMGIWSMGIWYGIYGIWAV